MIWFDPFVYDDAAYVLGALDEPERTWFETHLEDCVECAAWVDAFMGLLPALEALRDGYTQEYS